MCTLPAARGPQKLIPWRVTHEGISAGKSEPHLAAFGEPAGSLCKATLVPGNTGAPGGAGRSCPVLLSLPGEASRNSLLSTDSISPLTASPGL
ncbi:hypothetical protein CapIbe_001809 [Capra ibex]